MPLSNYGVLKGYPVDYEAQGDDNHIFIHVVAQEQDYAISFNVQSCIYPVNLQYRIVDPMKHPLVEYMKRLPEGFTSQLEDDWVRLDYKKDHLFDYRHMSLASHHTEEINELGTAVIRYVKEAMEDPDGMVIAYGQLWGPKGNERDAIFGFKPSQGIHNIHRNQDNEDDGVHKWHMENGDDQDGALFFWWPGQSQWVGVFCCFQSIK